MLLLIDAGNTRIKWAIAAAGVNPPGTWLACGAVNHDDIASLAPIWRSWQVGQTGQYGQSNQNRPISQVHIANVAGLAVRQRLHQSVTEALGDVTPNWFRSTPHAAGVRNAYRDPRQLGCDRFAAAIGAHALYPHQALLVANCGTATTIDAISAEGVFSGGLILPGLSLMTSALARNTAQLPEISRHQNMMPTFSDNTDDAILSGCRIAQSAAITHALALQRALQADAQCILSGGAAATIASALSIPHQIVDNLVLIGLHTFAMRNQSGTNDRPINNCTLKS
jgi:type III pantothenate kinase